MFKRDVRNWARRQQPMGAWGCLVGIAALVVLLILGKVMGQGGTTMIHPDNNLILTIEKLEIYGSAGNWTPQAGMVYVALLGQVENQRGIRTCIQAREIRLILGETEYTPINGLMERLKPVVGRDYLSAFNGQCFTPRFPTATFAAFEVPAAALQGDIQVMWFGMVAEIDFSYGTQPTRTPTPSPTATATPSAEDLVRQVFDNSWFAGRKIELLVVNEQVVTLWFPMTNLSAGAVKYEAETQFAVLACALRTAGLTGRKYQFLGTVKMVDAAGRERSMKIVEVIISAAAIRQMNCDAPLINLPELADRFWYHSSVR
jgi:hypothetical protein